MDWTETGVEGIHRFLGRVYRFATRNIGAAGGDGSADTRVLRKLHQVLRKITQDFDQRWHFNTSIAAMMELVNEAYLEESKISAAAMAQTIEALTFLLAPFAPYLAQELWEEQGQSGPVFKQKWPAFDEGLARESEVEVPVQINGKIRARITVAAGLDKAGLEAAGLADEKVRSLTDGKAIVKVIAVPDKLLNIVLK
jgi:leucyl-tRNA synthetase